MIVEENALFRDFHKSIVPGSVDIVHKEGIPVCPLNKVLRLMPVSMFV